jgi:hypothetical protein
VPARRARDLRLAAILIVCSTGALAQSPAPSKPELAARILSQLDRSLSDAEGPADAEWVRQTFRSSGLPSIEQVGAEPAEDFVLLCTHDQAVSFMEEVAAAIARLPSGAIPEPAGRFLSARLLQKRADEALPASPRNPDLHDRIERLYAEDQRVRTGSAMNREEMMATDAKTGPEVRKIFATYGVPAAADVGADTARNFVVLVQHQPADLMRQVLPALEEQVRRGEADPSYFAMMFDRARVFDRKPQRYGENFECDAGGKLVPSAIEDAGSLDVRRADVGLLPMRIYRRLLAQMYPKDFCSGAPAAPVH